MLSRVISCLLLTCTIACANADEDNFSARDAQCDILLEQASDAAYQDLPAIADELVADQCSSDELRDDLASDLAIAVSSEVHGARYGGPMRARPGKVSETRGDQAHRHRQRCASLVVLAVVT